MSHSDWILDESPLGPEHIPLILSGVPVRLSSSLTERIRRCRAYLDQKMADPQHLFYGINTGFGYLQHVRIDGGELQALQENLLKSHACGMGEEVPAEIVRLMLIFKSRSLGMGHSGVQELTVQRLIDFYNEDMLPVVYTQGSLGASGDLAPLSHLCLPLLGIGEVIWKGRRLSAAQALQEKGWAPIVLQSKEGLALINGTQFMTAYGMYNLHQASRLLDWADRIAALSFEAFDGVPGAFHPLIQEIRPHPGQITVAARMRDWLNGSSIASRKKEQVQDPYSFRCIPQVHGASRDVRDHVLSVFLREVNAVTDNPNVFPDEDQILSGGNFHGQPLALSMDYLSMALSELASISERRTYQLTAGLRGLPVFLAQSAGLHSGFMIPQYTAASIVSENKQLCTPASVDSIPSSLNQEDHVSMGARAAVKAKTVADNVEKVLAIELLTAAQAFEFRRPARSSEPLEALFVSYRKQVSFNDSDRYLHDDMVNTVAFLRQYNID